MPHKITTPTSVITHSLQINTPKPLFRERLQTQSQRLSSRLLKVEFLTAGSLLLVSMTIVNIGNYLFNLILGRWLGPAAFADVNLMVTLLLMSILITATLQIVSAKFAAIYTTADDPERVSGLRRWLGRWAWGVGVAILTIFVFGAPLWQEFFHTRSAWPFVLLGLGLPFYLAQGVDRGILQGQKRFGLLAASYQTEMWVRLAAALAFVALGWSVNGAVGGISLSFVATWAVARQANISLPRMKFLATPDRLKILSFAGPVGAALIGQILINNSDILIVKHFFVAEQAGQYAALALIGRIVFFATSSVVAVMFPMVAQKQQKGEAHRHLLAISLGVVALVSLGIVGLTVIAPELIIGLLFGKAYLSIAPLLWLYAIATLFYALANVLVYYRLSLGNGGGSVLAVLAGAAQVLGLWFWHNSLLIVVMIQICIMAIFLCILLTWDTWLVLRRDKSNAIQN